MQPGPEALVARVEELSARLEQVADPFARAAAEDLVGAIMDLYGEGFERIVAALLEAGEPAAPVRAALLEDGVVASLLLIHDLYPVSLEDRVEEALESVRPYLASHGGSVELASLQDGVARLRLEGSCRGCPASSATLELAIKQALEEAAPDLTGLEVEGLAGAPALAEDAAWVRLEGVAALGEGALRATRAGDVEVVVARVEGALLAYRNACARCGSALDAGTLVGGVVECPSCASRFSMPGVGRALERGGAPLDPVPLLDDKWGVRVAVAGAAGGGR